MALGTADDVMLGRRIAREDNRLSAEVTIYCQRAPSDASLNVDGVGTVYIY